MTQRILFQYSDPEDPRNEYLTEFAKIGGILVGIGAAPFLEELVAWYWVVGLVVGLLTMLAAVGYWTRQALRQFVPEPPTLSGFQKFRQWLHTTMRAFGQHLVTRMRRVTRRQQPAPVARTPQSAPPQIIDVRTITILPIVTLSIGVFIVLAALIAFILQSRPTITNAGPIAIYFSAPAVLLWLFGEGVDMYPHFLVTPKHRPQWLGIAKSGLQSAAALFLWVYLGVAIGMDRAEGLLIMAALMAVVGAGLGVASIEAEKVARQAPEKSPVPNHV